MKLSTTEAAKLLAFMVRTCRPATPELQREFDHWVKRLTGPRS